MSYGEADSHPSGFEQGNTGYSGAPLWKIKQQTAQHQALVQQAQQTALEEQKKLEAQKKTETNILTGPRIFADGVVMRGTKGQQLVRHMLVKDLRKAAGAMRMALPVSGIFDDGGGPRALFALFDGHGMEGSGFGPKASEHCCRHVLGNVLRNLLSLPADSCTATFVKAALLKTFEDLDTELVTMQVPDRCSASLVLIIGEWLFSACLGRSGGVFCQGPAADQGPAGSDEVVQLRAGMAPVSAAALGTPEVKGIQVTHGGDRKAFFVLYGAPVGEAHTVDDIRELSKNFPHRPRATAGDLVTSAVAKLGARSQEVDCAAVAVFYRSREALEEDKGPAAKKAKVAAPQPKTDNVRIRHIFLRYKGAKQIVETKEKKPSTLTREEAEVVLRNALTDLLKDGDHSGDKMWAAKATTRIINKCREISECKSSLRGGSNCGDLGWLARRDLERMGKDGFDEAVCALKVAEWSDVLASDQGVHLVMRIA